MSPESTLPISPVSVSLSRSDLRCMMRLVHLLFKLSQSRGYRELVNPQLADVARFDPGHASLMMGYDFHLSATGPKLIEVNTNAGGAYLAWLSEQRAEKLAPLVLPPRYDQRLLDSFLREWRDFSNMERPLRRVAIMDDDPAEQPLYSEMKACCDWLCKKGIDAGIVSPEQLEHCADGVYLQGEKIDLIYNRHCDFFLEEESMAELRSSYLAAKVCLSPNPFAYGLLADKRRMILWSTPEVMSRLELTERERALLKEVVPHSRLLSDCCEEELWPQRKTLIFKPVTRFGSRGVLLGKGITRKRFAELDPDSTLVQQLVPPSVVSDEDDRDFKVDLRLYVYRDRLLGVTSRIYQGQVTNLRTEGGGFAPVRVV